MDWQFTPYHLPLLATGLISLVSAGFAYRQRQVPGASSLFKMLLSVCSWAFLYALELSVVSLEGKLLWAKFEYFFIVYVPVGYTLFVLSYLGILPKISRPRRVSTAVFIIPILTVLLVWTNELHGLIWPTTTLAFHQDAAYLAVTHGAGFWLYAGFAYLLLLTNTVLLLRKIIATPAQFQGQIVLLIAGSLSPWLANFLYLSGFNPFPYLDLTPFAFTLTSLFFAGALFRYKFLDIVPIARGVVIENLHDGVIVVDSQRRIIDINDTAVSLLRQPKRNLLGRPLSFQTPNWAPLAALLEEDRGATIELAIDQAYYEASVIPLEAVQGTTSGRLITLHNITQRKETEFLLHRAKEAAESADQAKTNFLTNMSHEIRTPLNAVVGMTEMLRQTPLNSNQIEMLDIVSMSSDALVSLINNILDFAKLEAGNLTLNQQTFDLVDCLESALESMRPVAQSKNLKLHYELGANTPTLLVGDPVRLRQVLINLLENGIKFTEEGQVFVSVEHSQLDDKALLDFVVLDNGIGIAPDQIQKLFVPFQQIDGSMTRAHGGNGLGLVICKRLVALMGGEIEIRSEAGQGTAVHFSAQFSIPTQADTPPVALRQRNISLSHKRLLVITKDAATRRQISKEARTAGLEVYAAGSCQEATYWIENSEPFDVVLLDSAVWQDEPAVFAQIVHKETELPLPIILLKTAETRADLETNLFAGQLDTPVTSSQLYDKLLNVLSANPASQPTQTTSQLMAARHPLSILLVEDNGLNQRIVTNMLAKLGYHPDLAENGQMAVEAVAQSHYDVILMDIQMPVMDGVEATQHILTNTPEGERPFIIAVTAHALEGDREYYLSCGMNEYISKPISLNQLVEALYLSIAAREESRQRQQPELPATAQPAANLAPASAEPGEPPIDLVELELLVGEDTNGFLEMMAPIFIEDTQVVMEKLAAAVAASDAKAIQQAAHTLKGTSASMAMKTLSDYSRQLETMAKADDLTDAPQKLQQIQREYGRVESALETFVKTAV